MRRTASTAKPVTSRTRTRTSTGYRPKAAAGRITRICEAAFRRGASTRRGGFALQFLKSHTCSFSAEAPPREIIVFKVIDVAQDCLPNVEILRAPGFLGEQIQAFFDVRREP